MASLSSSPFASPIRVGVACVCALLAMGCGPRMVPHVRDVRAFASPERCAQGPFEIHQQTHGEDYAESYAFVIYSPRAIRGHYQAIYDGEVMNEGEFGERREIMETTGDRDYPYRRLLLTEDEPDNARCLVTSSASGGAAVDGGSRAAAAPDPFTPGGSVAPPTPPAAATPTLEPVPWSHDEARLYGPDVVEDHLGRIDVRHWSWIAPMDGGVATEPGVDFTLRIWSDLPNDLEGVVFLVEHGYQRPNVSDEEWAEHQEAQARSDARRRIREQRRAARRHARRQAHCAEHHESESCWGLGGYEGAVARANAPRTSRPTGTAAPLVTPTPPEAPEPGPPPSPRAETQPPKPSQNARWIPGYWRWGGRTWVWLGGMWDVPETDVEAGLTVAAPSLPPPPRQETRPAAQAQGLVWIAGNWQWSGSAWVWVTGRWQAPPQGAGSYRAPRWQARGSGAIFVPGGFSVEVRVR